ncbi:4-hydroxy-3-methylbut-2-enyl diphosphate reductase [bacterium]|nr:4-hydroxy-3-methylbut-2-enyl diphosphate reductase [bacterium]
MKKLIIAKNIGFCFGVKRTVEMAEKLLEKSGCLYSIGDIVHNPIVIEKLKEKGLKVVENEEEIEKVPFIIRSHGLGMKKLEKLKKREVKIYDATCPFVKRVHQLIKKLDIENYFIIIIGNKFHPEIKALKEYGSKCIVFENFKELRKFKFSKIAVVGQTTLSFFKYIEIVEKLIEKLKFEEILIYNTICKVTEERQKEAKEISKKVDLMLILGGKKSSNTKKLFEICKENNRMSFHIEKLEELCKIPFYKVNSIGITSGTSTPDYFIREVTEYIKNKGFKEVE